MSREYAFGSEHEFAHKLKDLLREGVRADDITTYTPVPVHGLEEILKRRPSFLKFFTLFGGLTGCFTGYSFAIYTVYRWAFPGWDWGIITGGKPPVSIPAYTVIAFELTILFGAVCSLLGFMLLARMPVFSRLVPQKEYGNQFVIVVAGGEAK